MTDALVVLATTETEADAERLARLLVESELAACVQVLPRMTSIYRWHGKIEQSGEALLLIKTTRRVYDQLEAAIKQNHSYETPEIIALPVEAGSMDYLNWLMEAV
jgi:periplasmic divalent cation tolerance protein